MTSAHGRRASRWYRMVAPFQRRILNPLAGRFGRFVPGLAVLETVGRKSGLPRRTPVGGRLVGSTFWLVSEFGTQSQYVRNILADPHVRVRIANRWHSGTATVLPDDDARERLTHLRPANSLMVRAVGNELLTIRIDLT